MSSYQLGRYDIKEVQLKMLEILTEIDRICNKYHLRYLLDGGTMLGAVRHKGFIPWDDDADVMMPRDDYDQFLKVANDELRQKNMVFQCIENTRAYPYNFGKVFLENTRFVERFTAKLDISHGVYVDVFPMDYVDTAHYMQHSKMIGHYTMLRYYKLGISKRAKGLIAKPMPLSLINAGANAHMKYLKKKSGLVCKLCHHGKNKPPIPISLFDHYTELPFEGRMLRVPYEYDDFLKGRYGDYMRLPDKEHRVPIHDLLEIEI